MITLYTYIFTLQWRPIPASAQPESRYTGRPILRGLWRAAVLHDASSLSLDAEDWKKEQKNYVVTCLHAAVVTLRLV